MEERELIDIESRVTQYPAQARSDILRLVQALRGVSAAPTSAPTPAHLYDPLTGVLNGGAYGVRFAMARARATRFRKIFAVLSVEVTFGHAGTVDGGSDRAPAIKHIASRLEASVRATDTLARIGDESFAVILEDLTERGHAERVKQIIVDALAEPLTIDGRSVAPAISVAIEFYPSPGKGAATYS